MENLAILLIMLFFIGFIVCTMCLPIGFLKKNFKFKVKQILIGMLICFLGFIGSFVFFGFVETPKTRERATIVQENKKNQDTNQLNKEESKDNENVSDTKLEESKSNNKKEETKKAVANANSNQSNVKSEITKIDWEKCIADTKAELTNPEYFSYVKDVYIKVDEKEKRITFTSAIDDACSKDIALEFADTIIRRFNSQAQLQDSSIKSGSKDYLGSLYDTYNISIGIAPLSKTKSQKDWYVFDAIAKGVQREPKLQK